MRSFRSARAGIPFGVLRVRSLCAAALLLVAGSCGDGGTGPAPKPDPQNPTPAISSLDPGKLLQWSDSATVTVTGTGFINGSVVRLDGTSRLTTYVSPSQLTAVVPVARMQQAGTLQVTVLNPAPGGGESAAMALPVEHQLPELLLINPAGIEHGSEAFSLDVHGFGFTQGAVVRWNGSDRPTTFVNRGHLSAQIPAADVAAAGTAEVTVFNPAPGGGTSAARVFAVAVRPNPVARLTALTPSTIEVGKDGTFTLAGTGFVPGAQVSVGGFTPTTTVVSTTEVTFTLEASNLPTAGSAQVAVTNPAPGGGVSNVLHLIVTNPLPALTSLAPTQAIIGADSLVVRLMGSGFVAAGPFVPGTSVLMNDVTRSSRRVSATELEVVLDAEELRAIRTFSFQVVNPQPGGGRSSTLTLPVVHPAPVISTIDPANAFAGVDSLVVRVTGAGFIPATVGHFSGAARATRYLSPATLELVLRAEDLDAAGTFSITAVNPAPGGGTSSPAALTLTIPAPVLALIPSRGASAGRPGFPLVVHGTGFQPSSVVWWNGAARATRFISGTRLEANITTADVAAAGTAAISVHTPGGGTSGARQMTIRAVPSATLTSTRTVAVAASDLAYAPAHDRIYASIAADAGARQNMVVAINPHTGVVTDSVLVGSDPDQLAMSDDGSTLWVSLRATGQVRRLSLPGLVPGTLFSLGTERVDEMRVMPGQPGTLAIALHNNCCSPSHAGVAIYDNGVPRARRTPGHTGSNTIAFGESADVLYGRNTEYEYGFRTMWVNGEGVETVRTTVVGHHGFRIKYAAGRVYINGPQVLDAGRHEAVGSFPGADGVDMVPDPALGRAFFITYDSQLKVYDLNTFQLIGSTSLGNLSPSRRSLLQWGTDGLVYNDAGSIYIVRTPIAGP